MQITKPCLAILLIFISFSAFSQKKFIMGVKIGLNVATQDPIPPYPRETSAITRVHFGVVTETKLYKTIALQADFMYSGHGCRYTGITRQQLKTKFEYINVPMFLKWNITENLSVLAGPQFGMIFDQEFQDDRTGIIRRDDFSTIYSRFETSMGGGVEWKFENGIGFYARYVHGITDISEGISYLTFSKNKTTQFGFTYWF